MFTQKRIEDSWKSLVVDLVLWLSILPIILPIAIFFGSLKFFLILVLKIYYPMLQFVTDNDLLVARAGINKHTVSDIGLVFELEDDLSLDKLRQWIRLQMCPTSSPVPTSHPMHRLYCKFTSFFGYLCTQAVPIDLERQIQEKNVSHSIEHFFTIWFQSPYKHPDLPRWEMILLKPETKDREKGCSVGFRIHHGLVDGQSLLLLLNKLCGKVERIPSFQTQEKKIVPSYSNLVCRLPRDLITFLWSGFALWFSNKPFPTLKKKEGNEFHLSWTSSDLSLLKEVRRKANVPFSTVLYTVQSEAMRTYLENREPSSKIPDLVPVVHTIPRPDPNSGSYLGNHWTLVKIHTPLREPDMIRNLKQTAAGYSDFINKGLHISGPILITKFLNLLPTKWCLYDVPSPLSTFNLALSNTMRQPGQEIFCGVKTKAIYHVFFTKDLCPDAVLYTTTASVGDKLYSTHSGSAKLFPTQKDLKQFSEVHWQNAIRRLVRDQI